MKNKNLYPMIALITTLISLSACDDKSVQSTIENPDQETQALQAAAQPQAVPQNETTDGNTISDPAKESLNIGQMVFSEKTHFISKILEISEDGSILVDYGPYSDAGKPGTEEEKDLSPEVPEMNGIMAGQKVINYNNQKLTVIRVFSNGIAQVDYGHLPAYTLAYTTNLRLDQ